MGKLGYCESSTSPWSLSYAVFLYLTILANVRWFGVRGGHGKFSIVDSGVKHVKEKGYPQDVEKNDADQIE